MGRSEPSALIGSAFSEAPCPSRLREEWSGDVKAMASIPGMEVAVKAGQRYYYENNIDWDVELEDITLTEFESPEAYKRCAGFLQDQYNQLVYGIYTARISTNISIRTVSNQSVRLSADFEASIFGAEGNFTKDVQSSTDTTLVITSVEPAVIAYRIERLTGNASEFNLRFFLDSQQMGLYGSEVDIWVDDKGPPIHMTQMIVPVEGDWRTVGNFPKSPQTKLRAVIKDAVYQYVIGEYTTTIDTRKRYCYTWNPGGRYTYSTQSVQNTLDVPVIGVYLKLIDTLGPSGSWGSNMLLTPLPSGSTWKSGHLTDGSYDIRLDEVRRTCDRYRLPGLDELIEESGISLR